MCKGTLGAIELILRDIALDKTDISFGELLDLLETQVKMLREIYDSEKKLT